MKLLQCKIENFGKLSDVSFDFSEGVNTFYEENGWGKSTLANFIRIMFFGFLNGNKQDKLVNERKRYFPWQTSKGVYGGNVVFETGGKKYQLNRVFGKKEKDDVFELYDFSTNLPCNDFSEKIGEELFGIDAASFCRTVFFSQKDCESVPTDGIHAKLGNLTLQTDDIHNFQNVYDRLKDITNKMTPSRKTGSLNKEKREMEEKEQKLREEESVRQGILEAETFYRQCEEKEKEYSQAIAEERKRQEKLSKAMDFVVKKKEYETLVSAKEQAKKRWQDSKSVFPDENQIPSLEQVDKWQKQRRECDEFREQMLRNQLTEEEIELMSSVQEKFGEEIPKDEDLQSMEEALSEYESLKQTVRQAEFSQKEKQEWENLKKRYPNGLPQKEQLLELNRICDEIRHTEDQLVSKQTTARTLEQMMGQKKEGKVFPLPIVMLCLAVVLGVALCFVQVVVGVAAFVVLTIVSVILFGLQKRKKQANDLNESPILELNREIEADNRKIEQEKEKIAAMLESFLPDGVSGDLRDALQEMQMDSAVYESYEAKNKSVSEEEINRYQTLRETLRKFMDGYVKDGIAEERFAFGLSNLRGQIQRFAPLSKKQKCFLQAKEEYEQKKENFVFSGNTYGLTFEEPFEEELQKISGAVNRVLSAEQSWMEAGEKLSQFEKENDMERIRATEKPEENDGLSESHEREEQWMIKQEENRKNMDAYEKQLEKLEEKLDELAETRLDLEERKEHFANGKKKYDLLLKTMDKLQQAKDALTARYIEPVQKGFTKYYHMVDGGEAKDYRFDAGVNLTVQEMGMPREIRFLSEGRKDLAGICARMALVDAMYENDKPFLVFDDSFVNLDDEKINHALSFLKEIGKEYQVIYFTCHKTRKIK